MISAYDCLLWSSRTECRGLAALGVDVDDTSLERLVAPYMGRGRLRTLQKKSRTGFTLRSTDYWIAERVAWSHQYGEAFGMDLHTLNAVVLRQLYCRQLAGHPLNRLENTFIRRLLSEKHRAVSGIADMLIRTRIAFNESGEPDDQVKALIRGHEAALRQLREGTHTAAASQEYLDLAEKLYSQLATINLKDRNLEFAPNL